MQESGGASTGRPRGRAARIGIAALNLLAPGLGLLRIGQPRLAFLFYGASIGILLIIGAFWAVTPILSFALLVLSVAVALVATLALLLGSMLASWGRSRVIAVKPRLWSRWYGILGAWVVTFAVAVLLRHGRDHLYRPFYLPAESMAPTLFKNDRLIAFMRPPAILRRGDIILFPVGSTTYIKRIAALPGDVIALKDGIVIVNGRPVPQILLRTERGLSLGQDIPLRRLSEQFPGEARAHEIYDSGATPEDDYPATRVLQGHVFVLGDNRDSSADSRIPRDEYGVEQLAISDIQGTALYYSWGSSHPIGARIAL